MTKEGVERILRAWLPALGWMAGIVLLPRLFERPVQTALPEPEAQGGQFVRYLIHAAEYGVLALLLTRSLRLTTRRRNLGKWGRSQAVIFAFSLAYALFDELQQGLMPNREPSLADLLADGLGILLALAGVAVVRSLSISRLRNKVSGG